MGLSRSTFYDAAPATLDAGEIVTDLGLHSADDLAAVASALNGSPRKTLNWRMPAETFDALLRSDHTGVATTS